MASRFWVGGSGTWDLSSTAHWAATSGGASGASVPTSSDSVTLDANSGAAAVITVNANVVASAVSIGGAGGSFAGTLDFSANNNSPTFGTFSFSQSGGTRTLNLGNGTWTLNGVGTVWNMLTTTGLTFNANSSTLNFSATTTTSRTFTGGGLTYNNVNVTANSSGGSFQFSTAHTITNLTISPINTILFATSTTYTMTNFNVLGTSTSQILMKSATDGVVATLSVAANAPTIAWAAMKDLTCSGGASFVAQNCFDIGHNSGITINPPFFAPAPLVVGRGAPY